jgi:hypothetical protein
MRFPLPRRKLALIAAAYLLATAAFYDLGAWGLLPAILIGTAGASVILVVRSEQDLLEAVIVAMGSLTGMYFFRFFSPPPLLHEPTIADLVRDYSILAVGALVGGLFFSWASKR